MSSPARTALAACWLIGLVVVAGCQDGNPVTSKTGTASPSSVSPSTPPFARADDGGQLRIVEKGFSRFNKVLDEGDKDPIVSYGLVVENTSRRMIAVSSVDIEPLNQRGEKIRGQAGVLLPPVLPGQRSGGGFYSSMLGVQTTLKDEPIAEIRLKVRTQWWPLESSIRDLEGKMMNGKVAPLNASKVRVEPQRKHPTRKMLSFTVQSGYDKPVRGSAMAVLRSSSGAIIGGTSGWSSQPSPSLYSPGRSTGKIKMRWTLPGTDHSRTQVYLCPVECANVYSSLGG